MTTAGEGDTNWFSDVLETVKAGKPLNARNRKISGRAVKALIEAAPSSNGRPVLHAASFSGAKFDEPVSFVDVIFRGGAYYGRATFEGPVDFSGASFEGYAGFDRATFEREANFDHATFAGRADFQDTTWQAIAYFTYTTFEKDARFQGPTIFFADARFDLATFKGDMFVAKDFKKDVWFDRARFEVLRYLGPLRVGGRVVLDGAIFERRVTVAARADALSAYRTEFLSGADIYAQSAVIALDGAVFGAPSTLSSATRDTTYGLLLADAEQYEQQTIPRVVSVQGARVADLALHGVDLRSCRFRGAQGLDRLQLEQVLFSEPPTGWQRSTRWGLPIRWTRRAVIAEEHRWRAERHTGIRNVAQERTGAVDAGKPVDGWWTAELRVRPSTPNWRESDPPTPHQVAAVYRALRKAQEERKDEAGAGDFYYGEMEMRRAAHYSSSSRDGGESSIAPDPLSLPLSVRAQQDSTRRTPAGEKVVLYLYWLVSGYGMRASRALLALGVAVIFSALLLTEFGFVRDRSYGRSLLFAIESSVSLLKAPDLRLTSGGELVTVALRLLGPLFFGLALLSLRGRVKR